MPRWKGHYKPKVKSKIKAATKLPHKVRESLESGGHGIGTIRAIVAASQEEKYYSYGA